MMHLDLDSLPPLVGVCGAQLPNKYVADADDLSAALRGESPLRIKPLDGPESIHSLMLWKVETHRLVREHLRLGLPLP